MTPHPSGAAKAPPPLPPLIERDEALAVLGRHLDRAGEGVGTWVAIEGEPGTGKTRLLTEALRLASEHGITTYSAQGTELERGLPFGLVRQLLERPLADLEESELEALAAGPAEAAIELVRGQPTVTPPPRDLRFRLVNGFTGCSPPLPSAVRWRSSSTTSSSPIRCRSRRSRS